MSLRFQSIKATCHSTGALYQTICNNPRSLQYLREETILVFVFPGPHEPTLEQLNHVMTLFIDDLLKLYNGKRSDMHLIFVLILIKVLNLTFTACRNHSYFTVN